MFEDGSIKQRPLAYLAGSITQAHDGGAGWRTDITPHLLNLGYDIFNPVIDQPKLSGISRKLLAEQKLTNTGEYQKSCTKIVDTDLEVLKRSKIVIAKIDEAVLKGSGTFGELTVAHMYHIPVFALIALPGGANAVPEWAFGCIDHYTVHELDFYKMIPSGPALDYKMHEDNDDWDKWRSDT